LRNNSTLARSILEEIGKEGQIMRKYYQRRLPEDTSKDYYYIQRLTPNTQSLLIEYGFIDNANDAKKLQTDLLNYVEAVVRAVANYANVPYSLPTGSQTQTYTVQKGDSLYSIANKFNTSINELITLNQLSSNVLQIGQVLKIPTVITENEVPSTGYTVQKGDSLYSIANKFNTSVNELKALNNLTSNTLQIGQLLNIPTGSSGSTSSPGSTGNQGQTYTVQRGDSLYSIASKFNTTVNELVSFNNLTSNVLQIGQVLRIPTSTGNGSSNTYTVQKGDSLYSIANRFGMSVNELMRLNNLTTPLLIGQVLKLSSNNSSGSNSNVQTYTVQRGDSLYAIADRFNTTVSALMSLNNLTSNVLQIGQVLRIPNS